MNVRNLIKLLPLGLVLAGAARAQTADEQLTVSPVMDILRAGGNNDGSNGQAPAEYTFPARNGRVLAFSSVAGSWTCLIGGTFFGPDGTTGCTLFSIAGPVGSLAGFDQTDFEGALLGVFLEDQLPSTPPATLRFYVKDFSLGGIRTNFRFIFPRIGQVFFIGDGRTGTGTGNIQLFGVPATATHLYLGYIDSCNAGYSSPGCYSDNSGSVAVSFRLYDTN